MAKSLLDRMREKAKEAEKRKEERKNFESVNWFRVAEGDNRFRILPSKKEDELPFQERTTHFVPRKKRDGGTYNGHVRCLEDLEKECPICEAWRVEKKANPKGKLAENLRPSKRALLNILSYGTKTDKIDPAIFVWACPLGVHEDILGWVGDLGEFWDIDAGRNWRVRKTVDKKRGARMGTEYKVYPDMKDSAIPEKFKPLLEEAADLSQIWPEDEAEVYVFAIKALGVGEAEEAEDEEEDYVPPKKSKKPVKVEVEEDEEEDEEEEEYVPPKKSKKPAPKPEPEEDDEDEDDDPPPPPKKKRPVEEPKKKKKTLDEEIGLEDDLEAELRSLGI